ncbi:structural maintenance of chromosomes 1 protein [Ectocarpus siliculosus]|uniref:Structural maintenance of chromosomes protein n=1 Tax=Ectocarpus siliculosus TaxID=2880 RepID=D8LRP2_ECTSI|nr:structural maintenance of chromosomes 1 protein [Ectocarpus siliculosus]|eukprot:CBN77803.1 structural maintenance of chromosomes 1 protein [Ectocarpus siliculosus]
MGRLIRIEAENFKSYAGTQIIGPFKDFTAVIGPNGAGKSNLMDAISFVLGVQSKHLRSTKLSDLVFRADGAVPSSRRAMVKVVYMVGEGEEVGGQEAGDEVHFSRVISAGGASSYRLNDKEVTWESYEKRLRSIGVLVKARNFLVFQGDVESIASKSPKELTQLFEQISGSDESKAEYEELKAAKEKAEEDTIFSFKRKKGCQAERKQVKEQKEEAERFQKKLKEMEDLKIESFLVQLFHINKDVDEREEDIKLMREELEEAQEREKAADVILKSKKKEMARLNRELQKAQAELNQQKRLRDDMGPQHIKIKGGISTLKRQVADGDKALEKIGRDRDAQRGTVAALSRDIAAVKQREEAAVSDGKGKGKKGGGGSSGGLARLSEAKAAEYEKLKADARERGSGEREEMADVERQLTNSRSKVDQLRSEQASLDERLSGFDASAKRFRQRRSDMEKTTKKAALDRAELQSQLDELTGRSKGDALRATEIDEALRSINEQLRDAKDDRRMTKQQEKMADCLETLKRIYPGVRGRLVDLCKPTQRKFNVAVTTAAGRYMEAIVVDTKAECLECLSYMQTNKVGRAQFIPLDTIKVKPISESLRSLGPSHRLCADIMQGGDDGVRKAILFAVGNTIVSDTLDAARDLCFGSGEDKKIKAVTLNGFLISKSGNMTGGTTTRDLARAGQWDEKEFSELKQRRQELEGERETLSREHRNRSLKARPTTELETKIRGLANREKHSSADLDITREELKSIGKHQEAAEIDRAKVNAELGEREADVSRLEASLLSLQNKVDAVENEVFAPFLKSVGASDIRSFEEGQLKDMQEQYKARMKLQQHRSKLEAQLAHERSRDFDGPLDKLTRKINARRKELEDQHVKMEELVEREKSIMEAEDEAAKEHLAAKEVARRHEGEVKAAHSGRQKLVKERDGISKRIMSEESALEQLRAKLHGVLQEARVEQVALPLVGGGTLAGGGEGEKTRSRKRSRGEDGDEEEEEEEEHSEENSSMEGGARSSGASGMSLSGVSGTQGSSTAHFSQAQNASVKEDREKALEVDLSKLKKHRGAKDAQGLEEVVSGYRKQMQELQAQINQMTPNMRAVERFGDVSDRLKASGQTFEQSKQNAAGAVLKFNEVKQRRYDTFMQAYNLVSDNLNTIYKDLTRSSKHPLGGNAFLSLDNPEEPYLGGVKFNAMPPMKRFRDMEQLSGGEKTVAALGLLFAIHSFRPAPFFVMDEIDAALDNINVKKVCNYIQGRSGDFQSIVISLKDMFYEKADALVGICRDHATNSSRTLTLDLEAVGEA